MGICIFVYYLARYTINQVESICLLSMRTRGEICSIYGEVWGWVMADDVSTYDDDVGWAVDMLFSAFREAFVPVDSIGEQ